MSIFKSVYAAFPPLPSADYRRHTGQGAGLWLRACRRRDIAIAGRSATFALTEMPHGTAPTLALSALSHVAPKTLMDMVLTVEEHDAEHALASGIVSRLADDSELEKYRRTYFRDTRRFR